MKIALFVPCIVNHLMPEVAIATLELLEKLGHEVIYPSGQSCCGQVMNNNGFETDSQCAMYSWLASFKHVECDAIVSPSANCIFSIKTQLKQLEDSEQSQVISNKLYELTEFLNDIAPIAAFSKTFPHHISLQMSCHGLRMLKLAKCSESTVKSVNKVESILSKIPGINIHYPERSDECCGFGGTFSLFESAVSAKMGKDKAKTHKHTNSQFIVGYEPSCLLHLDGIIRRQNMPIKTLHIAQIINAAL